METVQPQLKVALVQTDCRYETVEANLAHIEEQLAGYQEDADIYLLPELFNSGYANAFWLRPEMTNMHTSKWLTLMAKRKQAAICGSIALQEDSKVYNRLLFVQPDGQIQHYDKRQIFKFSGEDKVFTKGEASPLFHWKGWKIKPIVCFDLRFPEVARNLLPYYDLLLCSAHWPRPRIGAWDLLLQARAIENQAYVAAVNRYGQEGEADYPGHSAMIDYAGKVCEKMGLEEAISTHSLDYAALQDYRRQFPFLPG